METWTNALRINNNADEPLRLACGISHGNNFTQVKEIILAAPRLKVENGEDFFPHNVSWNFNNKKPTTIEDWVVVNFSAHSNIKNLISVLIRCGELEGIKLAHPSDVFDESPHHRHSSHLDRVDKMLKTLF